MASDDSEKDIAEDVLPVPVKQPAVPTPLDKLFAWHKPRKQLVRQELWLRMSRSLVQRLKNDGRLSAPPAGAMRGSADESKAEVRCLTLPGIDYLDARVIGEECNKLECKLAILGFLASDEDGPVMARARVRQEGLIQAGYISQRSNTLPKRLEEATAHGAIREIRQMAPFHIVNVDACGSIAGAKADHAQRLVEAIHGIVELQLSRCTHRWIMFLTVEARKDEVHSEIIDAFCKAILENAAVSAEFASAASAILQPDGKAIEAAIAHARSSGQKEFLTLFAMGIGKWLLHFADQKQWSVRMDKAFCHSTTGHDNPQPTMCALAFEFIPPVSALQDRSGASRKEPSAAGTHPDDASLIVATMVKSITDADEHLASNTARREQLLAETRSLLKEAGYGDAVLAKISEL